MQLLWARARACVFCTSCTHRPEGLEGCVRGCSTLGVKAGPGACACSCARVCVPALLCACRMPCPPCMSVRASVRACVRAPPVGRRAPLCCPVCVRVRVPMRDLPRGSCSSPISCSSPSSCSSCTRHHPLPAPPPPLPSTAAAAAVAHSRRPEPLLLLSLLLWTGVVLAQSVPLPPSSRRKAAAMLLRCCVRLPACLPACCWCWWCAYVCSHTRCGDDSVCVHVFPPPVQGEKEQQQRRRWR